MDLTDAFPPFGLRLVSGDLELRLPNDAELVALADVALAGIHPDGRRPFPKAWHIGDPDDVRRSFVQHHWLQRGNASPEAWSLGLGVFRDGEPVGVQTVGAKHFPVTRSASTGSWLGMEHHGQGVGKRMRTMALHLLFSGFDARDATSHAYADNPESNGVSRSLGYAPNGQIFKVRQGESATENLYRMTRAAWTARPPKYDLGVLLVGAPAVRAMLKMDPQ